MRVPWWARWVAVGPLIRPGDEDDLPAIEWIVSKSPNPNSQSLIWWAKQLDEELQKAEEPTNLTRVAFWLLASRLSRDSNLMFWTAAKAKTLTEIKWNFVVPIGPVARAILTENWALLPDALEVPMIGAFWGHIKVFANETTRWKWHLRRPKPAVQRRRWRKQTAQGGIR